MHDIKIPEDAMDILHLIKFLNIAGSTCAGKGWLIKEFLKSFPDLFVYLKSCTTRPQEKKDDDSYTHLSVAEFEARIAAGEFLEWNRLTSNGHYYGTLRKDYEDAVAQGKIAINDLDNNGAQHVAQQLGDMFYSVFLDVSDEVLRTRMYSPETRSRDDKEKRLEYATVERTFAYATYGKVHSMIIKYDDRTTLEGVVRIIECIRRDRVTLLKKAQ